MRRTTTIETSLIAYTTRWDVDKQITDNITLGLQQKVKTNLWDTILNPIFVRTFTQIRGNNRNKIKL